MEMGLLLHRGCALLAVRPLPKDCSFGPEREDSLGPWPGLLPFPPRPPKERRLCLVVMIKIKTAAVVLSPE